MRTSNLHSSHTIHSINDRKLQEVLLFINCQPTKMSKGGK